ncbi:histidine kinase [Ectothiorhodospira mobilis]|nr:histidine kinase [Ectothiorhodospira mobilis]
MVPGLRAQFILILFLVFTLTLIPVGVIGGSLLEAVRQHFGAAFAEHFTALHRERILSPITRDLALSRRLAESEVTRRWLLDPQDEARRRLFFAEAAGYRRAFRDRTLFVIHADSRAYYYNDPQTPYSRQPRYILDPETPKDGWFFHTLAQEAPYNINVNPDPELGTTRVWINVLVTDGERRLGLAGTGLDLGGFLDAFIHRSPEGVTPMVLDAAGAIQAHPDRTLISFGSTTDVAEEIHTLPELLDDPAGAGALEGAMARARSDPGRVLQVPAHLEGRPHVLALSYIPELQWFVVSAVDLGMVPLIQAAWVRWGLLATGVLFLFLFMALGLAVDRTVLRRLRHLQRSTLAVSQGRYDLDLPRDRQDEIGDLTRAFQSMADQVRRYTDDLESRVQERTARLRQANREMALAQRQIQDSIEYACLIQRAILPDQALKAWHGGEYFVLWRPRDGVGGDFYLFQAHDEKALLGVVDCAGHGVPGALMTMLARAVLDGAVQRCGMDSPAAVLTHADGVLREMFPEDPAHPGLATYMDAGLVLVDRNRGIVRHAGARIGLLHSDGHDLGRLDADRRALGDRRRGSFRDRDLELDPARTYYLVSDGYVDQAGGEHGYGMGRSHFRSLILEHAKAPLQVQAEAFERALTDYMGTHPQRDDVTLLAFRVRLRDGAALSLGPGS